MTATDSEAATSFARHWIAAWNAHDLEGVLAHYADDVELSSPFVASIAGDPSGKLKGKGALRAYWGKAFTMVPDLRFELIDVLAGVGVVTLYYRGHRGMVAETLHLGADGKVRSASACYAVGSIP